MRSVGLMLDEVSIGVIDGEVAGDESWVYLWLKGKEILYVGATRLPLGARTWLHLTDDDPAVGKIRAQYPEATRGRVTVHGWRLPDSVDRVAVRDALAAHLEGHSHELEQREHLALDEIADALDALLGQS